MTYSRREILRYAALGAGALGGLSLGLRPGRARAASGLAGPFGGGIFFVLNGGARTQCVFNGTVAGGTNPFGQISALPVPVSAVQAGTGLDDPDINRRLNLITTVQHHNRTGNHDTGRVVACTGFTPEEAKPGILTILNYSFALRDVPCVNLGSDTPTTAIGSEISSTFSPIKLRSPLDVEEITASLLDARVSENEQRRLDDLRYAVSDAFLRRTPYMAPADIPYYQRRAVEVATQFENDALDIRTDASMGRYLDGSPVSNGALRAAFGVDGDGGGGLGAEAMLAVRLRQLGCGGITVSTNNWDMHSNEDASLPRRAAEVGRVMAALVDQMSRIDNPLAPGTTLLDSTVMTCLSDFGRGNWSAGSGFNGAGGSDHISGEDKTCYQCIPIVGGGLPGGVVLGEVRGDGSPAPGSPTYTTRQVLATTLDLLGIESSSFLPESAPPLTEDLLR